MIPDSPMLTDYSEALAFAGNSLLSPMSRTGAFALDPGFWAVFPDMGDAAIACAIAGLADYARDAQRAIAAGENAVQHASVEYTKLFVGPPRPAAAPWETMYRPGNTEGTAGFGAATFEMQALLRETGLEVSSKNNQYADHIGLELLFASELCSRAARAGSLSETEVLCAQAAAFANEHPLAWIGKLEEACENAAPEGYIVRVLRLAQALLEAFACHFPEP